ncbi:MAG: BREX-3 system P-loop-containing protein BrxF [Sandaracinaceae bacterium]|nr:BREX-3 system P-loop-containing protein BrxF [Sandaracinaceae bacterium]
MTQRVVDEIRAQIEGAAQLYHRLVLVVGPPRSGKTTALRQLREQQGWPLLNINLLLAERLLELTTRKRALRVARIVDDIVGEQKADPIMLDNIEMLFHPELKQDPLRLFQGLSRNRTIVATWRGAYVGKALTYATPDHPEYRRFDEPQALIVNTGAASAQEHSA